MASRIPRHIHRVGVSRREVIQAGFLGAFGMFMTDALDPLRALAQARGPRAKSVILVWLPGGPPQMALWDLKPDSPSQMRGSARPIKTSAPGIEMGHWLPMTAKQAGQLIVDLFQSLAHKAPWWERAQHQVEALACERSQPVVYGLVVAEQPAHEDATCGDHHHRCQNQLEGLRSLRDAQETAPPPGA